MCFCQHWYLALTASLFSKSFPYNVFQDSNHTPFQSSFCSYKQAVLLYQNPLQVQTSILLMFLAALICSSSHFNFFSLIWLNRTVFQMSLLWDLVQWYKNFLLFLEMFALEHLRIGFAFFTDASHYFRNLIPLKRTIKLKWHWNKLILTPLLYCLSKQSTFLTDIFPSLSVRVHLFVIKSDFPV